MDPAHEGIPGLAESSEQGGEVGSERTKKEGEDDTQPTGVMGFEALIEQQPTTAKKGEWHENEWIDGFKLFTYPHVFKILHYKIVKHDDAKTF
jgi:hypothetical protein